jgi:aspartate-semialdehyde dehydrogenase
VEKEMERYRVGILGATGVVGQRLVARLEGHPWFELAAVAASERSAGKRYRDAVGWTLAGDPPASAGALTLSACRPEELPSCDLVLSALDAAVAREVEPAFARAGFAVVSNSSAFRQGEDVPLLIPEVNGSHVALLDAQRARTGGGYIVTNPNCSVTGLALAVAPLDRAFGLSRLVVTTMQAISGAGADGPRALDLVDNVIPYIPGEEEKIESELGKILGAVEAGALRRASVVTSAHCHRVPTLDGHLEAVSFELARPATAEEIVERLRGFRGETAGLDLPSAAEPPIVVRDEPDRPQPRRDRDTGSGMAVVVGRVRPCRALGWKMEILSHNTVRGAAGGAMLNAELLAARELLPRRGHG